MKDVTPSLSQFVIGITLTDSPKAESNFWILNKL